MNNILDGKKVSQEILENIKQEVLKLDIKPTLAVILVGENPASQIYVRTKEKRAIECGFNSKVIKLKSETTKEELLKVIEELNQDDNINAILLQLPLPKHLNDKDFIEKIDPKKDVDGFHPINTGKLITGDKPFAIPCTPLGIMTLLKKYNVQFEGKNVLVIGRSNIVGKPIAHLLLKENSTVTIAHSKTKNLKEIAKNSDIIICATGIKNILTSDMIKEGAIIVDVGIIRNQEGKLQGDVDFPNVQKKAGLITPVPGGVGPMTIATLMQNTLELFKIQNL